MNSDEFQLYKTAKVEEYNLISSVNFEIVGQQNFPVKKGLKNPSEIEGLAAEGTAEERLREVHEKNYRLKIVFFFASFFRYERPSKIYLYIFFSHFLSLLRGQLGHRASDLMDEMLRTGRPIEDVLQYFNSEDKTSQEETEEYELKINNLDSLETKVKNDLAEVDGEEKKGFATKKEILESEGLGPEQEREVVSKSMEEVEEMLRRGHSLSEVIKHFMTPNTTEKEKLDALISNLNDEGRLHLIFPINLNPKVHNLIPP